MSVTPRSGARTDSAPRPATRARRPAAVTILAVLELLGAVAFALIVVELLVAGASVRETLTGEVGGAGTAPVSEVTVAAIAIMVGALGVAALAAGILLFRMQQVGWTLTMLLTGVGLASSIILWWTRGTTVSISVMVQVLTVFYLNQRQVRVAFGISRRRASDPFDERRA